MSSIATEMDCELGIPHQPDTKKILKEMAYPDLMCIASESSPDKVYTLDLHGHKIGRISNLEKFTHLRCLDLSCNLLERIEGMESITFLCELKLYSNRITEIRGLCKLKSLVLLSLQMNKISDIGKGLKDLGKLEMLRLDFNKGITQVDASMHLEGCSSLLNFNLAHNRIQTIKNFSCMHKLDRLDLSHNLLSSIQGLVNCNSISELNLSGNKLSGDFELPQLKCLQSLNISNNSIQKLSVSNQFKQLSEIQCNNNKLEHLPQNMKVLLPQLQILEVKENVISDLRCLCHAIKDCQHLTSLLLDSNPLLNTESESDTRDQIKNAAPSVNQLSAHKLSSFREVRMEEVRIETTFKEMENSLSSYEDLIQSTIENMESKFSCDLTTDDKSTRPTSRCHSRARLNEALEFASKHFKN